MQTFSDETFLPETASTSMTYAGSFQQERESTAIEFDFFCFAMKRIHLLIYFQNLCNFVGMLLNAREQSVTFLFTSFTSLTCLKRQCSSKFGFVNLLHEERKKMKKNALLKK